MQKTTLVFAGALLVAGGLYTQSFADDALEKGFRSPPNSAKPHTWYHMMNGNVTKEGITCDFEALARAGVGGVQMFDAGCAIPPGDLDFNSPAWFDMFKHAAAEARRLGLEICIPNCSGWSSSGGPWNTPANGMKRLVFTETPVKGPAVFKGKLPREKKDNGFYEDIAVLAFPVPPAEARKFSGLKSSCNGNTGTLSSDKPFTVRGISYRFTFEKKRHAGTTATIEISEDGKTFKKYDSFNVVLAKSGHSFTALRYYPFKDVITVKAVRVSVKGGHPANVAEIVPESRLRICNINSKNFSDRTNGVALDASTGTDDEMVRSTSIVNLTSKMTPDGALEWDAPAGDWTIFRIGYICNGRNNHPASQFGKGLEVDKLSASAMDFHFAQYVERICKHLGPLAGDVESGFNNILVDSYEVGTQNWTQGFDKTFEKRAGYSITPWLPVLAGHVVDSVDASERFLEDFRRVVAELFAENYAGRLAELCHRQGLKLSIEPYGNSPSDDLQYGQDVDIPMGEFWSAANSGNHYVSVGNSKFASYLAHVWGRRYAATESFTARPDNGGRWQTTPFTIKAQGDRVFCAGINRIIYHRFTHQPWPGNKYLPGMTMGRWGMHLDRTQTWWPYAGDWFKYQARCQWMLQEGRFVADVLYFHGEKNPNPHNGAGPDSKEMKTPDGYDWDNCAKKALQMLKVVDGRVVVPGGVSYALLVLHPGDTMALDTLSTVERLLDAGAKVCCPAKPIRVPGLAGYPNRDAELRARVDKVWAKGVMECTPAEALKRLGIAPDFESTEKDDKTGAKYIHRRDGGSDWYFVALNNTCSKSFDASFRISGRQPEIWDAEKGTITDAPQWRVEKGRTVVTLTFPPSGSAFVLFRRPVSGDRVERVAVKVQRRPDPVAAESRRPFSIEKAIYGLFDASGEPVKDKAKDFTSILAERFKGGALSVEIGNRLAGGDPAYRQHKQARITYVYDGVRKTVTLKEHANFKVPSVVQETDPAPDWEWRGKDILAWQPLTATVTTASGAVRNLTAEPPAAIAVNGAWRVTFPIDWYTGGTAKRTVEFPALATWSTHSDPDIRYFSGTATYTKRVPCAPAKAGARTILDLGEVKNFAEVTVNGKTFPVLWKPPYRVDITDALDAKADAFELAVKVTNLWPNRLIGDDALPPDCEWKGVVRDGVKEIGVKEIPQWVKEGKRSPTGRHTFTTWRHWAKDESLLPSGILGPVFIRTAEIAR